MRYIIVSVYDRAAGVFSRPFISPSAGMAIRSFSDEVNRVGVDSVMNAHADDYDLFLIGYFEDVTGLIECCVLEQLCIGKQVFISRGV